MLLSGNITFRSEKFSKASLVCAASAFGFHASESLPVARLPIAANLQAAKQII
jgi:hypothetical protein